MKKEPTRKLQQNKPKLKQSPTSKQQLTKANQEPIIIGNTVFELTVSWKKVEPAYQAALKKVAKTLKIDGFRLGKVPIDVAEKNVNIPKLIEESLQTIIPDIYLAEIKKRELKPLTTPRITPVTLAKGNDVVIKVEVAEKPKLNIQKYQTIVKKAKKEAEKSHKTGQEKDHQLDDKHLLDHVYAGLIQQIRPQVPELLITREVEYQLDDLIRKLKKANMDFDIYLKQMGTDYKSLANNLATQAVGKMQLMFILDEIAKKEKLEVSDKELDEYFKTKADSQMKSHSQEPNYRQYVKELLLRDKMTQHLLAI